MEFLQCDFFGRSKDTPMPVSSAQKAFYKAKKLAGITEGKGIHTLRHYAESRTMPSN